MQTSWMATLKAVWLYWKLALFRVSGKALMAGMTSVVATLNGSQWGGFSATEKFVAVITAMGAMWLVIDAFLDQTISRIEQNPDGLGIPGADVSRKTTVDSHQVTTETKTP